MRGGVCQGCRRRMNPQDWTGCPSIRFFFPNDETVFAELHRQGTESTFTAHMYSKGEPPLLLA